MSDERTAEGLDRAFGRGRFASQEKSADEQQTEEAEQRRMRAVYEAEGQKKLAEDAELMLTKRGLLPKVLPTLEFLPAEKREQYSRQFDGTFRLDWITADDNVSMLEYLKEVSLGIIRTYQPGDSPAKQLARVADGERAQQQLLDELDRKARIEKQRVYDERKQAAEQEFQKRFGLRPQ